ATKAGDQAAEAFDLAISQGDASAEDINQWIMATNLFDQMYFAATMLRGLPGYQLAPIPDQHISAELRNYASNIAIKIATTGNLGHTAVQNQANNTPDMLKVAIIKTIDNWPEEKIEFEIAQNSFTMSRGQA